MRAAIAAGQALLPLGTGTLADFGNLPTRPETNLRSNKLSGVIEYDAANQLAVFGAGTTLPMAQAVLAENRQWIPIRPPLAADCTVGGIVALGACGPERAYYGAPRDRLLGLKFVSGSGRHISAGGKVMKNVAGYDITRLLSGSAGTLGLRDRTEHPHRVHSGNLPRRSRPGFAGTMRPGSCPTTRFAA